MLVGDDGDVEVVELDAAGGGVEAEEGKQAEAGGDGMESRVGSLRDLFSVLDQPICKYN